MTDANVVLGLMPEGPVADGQITISAELAQKAVVHGVTLAKALGAKVTGLTVRLPFDDRPKSNEPRP